LLGDGCHDMGNAWFDGPMNYYVYPGTTAVKSCSSEWISGCSGGGSTSPSSGSGQCSVGYHFEYNEGTNVVCFADGGNHDTYKVNGGTAISCATTYKSGCPGSTGGGSTSPTGGYCGDNACNNGETTSSCPNDCGSASGETCGNNFCGPGETSSSCPADCGGTGSSSGGSCPTYGFGSPDGSYACNYNTCSGGCNFDSQGCPVSCYASSGGSPPSGGDPQTDCASYGGTYDATNNYCQMPGSPPSSGDPATDCANYGGTWDAGANFCNMPGGQSNIGPRYLLGQLNAALIGIGKFVGRLFGL
jgi:hypothetical protein